MFLFSPTVSLVRKEAGKKYRKTSSMKRHRLAFHLSQTRDRVASASSISLSPQSSVLSPHQQKQGNVKHKKRPQPTVVSSEQLKQNEIQLRVDRTRPRLFFSKISYSQRRYPMGPTPKPPALHFLRLHLTRR